MEISQNDEKKVELPTVGAETTERRGDSSTRIDEIENKIDKLTLIMEKYDIPRVADIVQKANNDFVKLNNDCKEFNGQLNKAIDIFREISKNEDGAKWIDGKCTT